MPIRPIDRFISALHRQQGEELLLESGKPGRIRVGTEERVLLAQDVRTDQIELLLRDALNEQDQRSLRFEGEATCQYTSPTGPVVIRAKRSGDRLSVAIRQQQRMPFARIATTTREVPMAPVPAAPRVAVVAERPAPGGYSQRGVAPDVLPNPSRQPRGPAAGGFEVVQAPLDSSLSGSPSSFTFPPPAPPTPHSTETGSIELDIKHTTELPMLGTGELKRIDSIDIVAPPSAAIPLESHSYSQAKPAPRVEPEPRRAPEPEAKRAPEPEAKRAPEPERRALEAKRAPEPEPRRMSAAEAASIPPGPKKLDRILTELVNARSSDLHLTSGLTPRMRCDGEIGEVPGFPDVLESDVVLDWLMEIAPPKSRAKFEATNDADYGYEIQGVARFRVNAFRDRRGVGGVIRVIPATVLSADQLGLPPAVRELCTLHKGLVLVTGPTGSGKSTTLAAMVDLINQTRADHVITIEDPVEFVHQPKRCLVNQREVHSHTESFSSGLRAALREDPDIVLVGEMRDLETIGIAIETAETGHLVFGTLHTTTAVSTVDRIIDQFPADRQQQIRVMLSSALKGVIAQTLCKKLGGGRVAALEILLVLPAVANLIREGKTFQIASVMQTGRAMGMQTLNDALFGLAQNQLIAPAEAIRLSLGRAELRAMLDRAHIPIE